MMKIIKILPVYLLVIVCAIVSIACSNGKSPVVPSSDDISGISNDLPESIAIDAGNRSILAVCDAVIDPVKQTFTIEPSSRDLSYHGALTQLYPNALTITDYGWSPNFWVDITLTHPLPKSGIIVFDPRVIAILPANPGLSFNYPTLNCVGNNSAVLEPDGYTKLYDNLGGTIPGNTNPFKAYFKDQPNRRWMDQGASSETQRWQMNLSGLPFPFQYKLVVDISTNYPQLPTPVVDNAPEPVQINAIVGPGLNSSGGSADITVTLLDWQGHSGIGGVKVEAPDFFNGTVNLTYFGSGPNPNEYVYSGVITNSLLAFKGEHKILVATMDSTTGIYIYGEFSVTVTDSGNNGNLVWVKRAGGNNDDSSEGITTLSDDSTVVVGQFRETATFGQDEPGQTILTSAGEMDIFVAKYNPDGSLAWAKRAGGTSYDYCFGITTLSNNSTAIIGTISETAVIGEGEPNEIILTSRGIHDILVARYNPNGTLAWAKHVGGYDEYCYGQGITTLSDNSIVVTGEFTGNITAGLTSHGSSDIFVARYYPDGTLAWAKRAGGTASDSGSRITTLSDNSTVVSGFFSETASFGEGEPNETFLTTASAGRFDIFVARYNSDGTLVWAKRAGGPAFDWGHGITTLSDNSTVLTGFFSQTFTTTATFGEGEPNETILTSAGDGDIYIARYNSDGTLAWAKRAGSSLWDLGYGATTLSDNSTVVTGYFQGSATFGQGEPNETVLIDEGTFDVFIARYDSNGLLLWAKRAGGPEFDFNWAVTTLSDNSIVASGLFSGTATFGQDESNETIMTSEGGFDIFIARFEP